jgi:hypothetical protein
VAKSNTVAALIDGYLANQDPKKSKRAVEDEAYRFARYVIPRIGARPCALSAPHQLVKGLLFETGGQRGLWRL